jgi:hypothetical protein
VVARDVEEHDVGMDFYSPFGPLIARFQAPAELVDRLNRYADDVVSAHQAASTDPLGEFGLPEGFLSEGGRDSVAGLTGHWICRYLARADDRDAGKIRFEMFWMVRQFTETFSPVHFHSGDISGVLYLKVPEAIENEAAEEEKTYIGARRAGYITFLIGGKQQYSKSLISFKPQVGDFYIFPGWLLHAVEPFVGEGERRSMAFNAFVE